MSKFGRLFEQKDTDIQVSESLSTQNTKDSSIQVSNSSKKGRPKGKRSDPDYEQVTAYIKKETYRSVKIALLSQEQGEFSKLVQDLLEGWLKQQSDRG